MKIKWTRAATLVLASLLFLSACNQSDTTESETVQTTEPTVEMTSEATTEVSETEESVPEDTESSGIISLKEDFYDAVNAEWLESAVIPADKVAVGAGNDLQEQVISNLMQDFDAMVVDDESNSPEMNEFLKFYQMAIDFDSRNEDGAEPTKIYQETLTSIKDLADFNHKLPELMKQSYALPFSIAVTTDNEDSSQKALALTFASPFLPDKAYYDNPVGSQILELQQIAIQDVFILYGLEEFEAAEIAEDAIAFDAILAEYMMSAEDSADFTKLFNKVSFAEYAGSIENIDFSRIVQTLVNQVPVQIIVPNPEAANALDTIVNEENFDMMINWMRAVEMVGAASFLSDEMREAAAPPDLALMGLAELPDAKLSAYSNASLFYGDVIGDYYGRTYFGEAAKQDVTQMVEEMIDVYRERLSNNQWLGEETIEAAIRKLDQMTINIGYPDEIQSLDLISKFVVTSREDGGSFYSNASAFTIEMTQYIFETFNEPVDRTLWPMTAATVNAMYAPSFNSITFSAAFMQEPFYSEEYSASRNYGSIGAVIGHEITHAFDTNGSTFDEKGNMVNWWTEEDYLAFEELTKAMELQFDGVETEAGPVNGTLTLSENIADAGGLSCALEVVTNLPDADLEDFFMSWATIWRSKMTPEMAQYVLAIDSHAPNKLRVNMQVQNFAEFFETFDVQEGDGMYRAPEDRVQIW